MAHNKKIGIDGRDKCWRLSDENLFQRQPCNEGEYHEAV